MTKCYVCTECCGEYEPCVLAVVNDDMAPTACPITSGGYNGFGKPVWIETGVEFIHTL